MQLFKAENNQKDLFGIHSSKLAKLQTVSVIVLRSNGNFLFVSLSIFLKPQWSIHLV